MIPKIIHCFWIGGKPIPKDYRRYIESWKTYCPDYEIKIWNEQNYPFQACQYMIDAIKEKKYGFAIDVARLDVLYQYGGIYFDTDVELLKPIDDLLKYKFVACFEGKKYINFGSIVASEKGNPVVLAMFQAYKKRKFINNDQTLNLTPCGIYGARDLHKLLGVKLNGKTQDINGSVIFSKEYFDPKDVNTELILVTERTYSIHHFSSTWFTPVQKKRHDVKKKILLRHKIFGKLFALIYVFWSYLVHEGPKTVIHKIKEKL